MIWRFLRKQHFEAELSGKLHAYALALTHDADLAEDLTRRTLQKMLKWRRLPRGPRSLQRYAFKMLRNLHIDDQRRKQADWEFPAEPERLFTGAQPSSADMVDRLIVRDAFSQLSDEHREILFLVDIMGFQYAEAADTLGISETTVTNRVGQARASMLDRLHESPVHRLTPRGKRPR